MIRRTNIGKQPEGKRDDFAGRISEGVHPYGRAKVRGRDQMNMNHNGVVW